MPASASIVDPRVVQARDELRRFLVRSNMTATRLSELSGVPQPQVSKVLSGVRKRWSTPIEQLCQYAKISIPDSARPKAAEQRLSRALRQALGNHDDPRAVDVLARVIEALTPAVAALCSAPSLEPSHDHGK